jgi:hypothetical protein
MMQKKLAFRCESLVIRMNTPSGVAVISPDGEEDDKSVFPSAFKIIDSKDRKNAEGKTVYPSSAYTGFADYLNGLKSSGDTMAAYNVLIGTALKEPTARPVQDYTVELVQ